MWAVWVGGFVYLFYERKTEMRALWDRVETVENEANALHVQEVATDIMTLVLMFAVMTVGMLAYKNAWDGIRRHVIVREEQCNECS